MTSSGLPLSPGAVAYAWRELARRAGVAGGEPAGTGFEALGIQVFYGPPEQAPPGPDRLIVVPCHPTAWAEILDAAAGSAAWLSAREMVPPGAHPPFGDPVPILFRGSGSDAGSGAFAERRSDGSLVFSPDILAATVFMLSRWEETAVPVRDAHDRFPATAAIALRHGFLDRPIIDEYGLALRQWLALLRPGWVPARRPFQVKLSHDIDQVYPFRVRSTAVRALGGDLLKRRSPRRAWRTMADALAQVLAPERTSTFRGIATLAELAERLGLVGSAFYVMTADPRPPDNDYDLAAPMMRRRLGDLQARGVEIGLHPGYDTLGDPELLAAQKARLDAVLGRGDYGGRQHFLRFRAPSTWRHWESAGLTYDSTLGFADHEGFRCGTCHPYRPYDLEQDRELDLWEIPLIAMDATLRRYRGLTPEQGVEHVLRLAQRCRQVEGTFTLLWHNTSLAGEWHPWAAAYERMLAGLAEMV